MVPVHGKFGVRKAQSPALREALSPNPTTRRQQQRALTWQASHSRYYSDFEVEDQVTLRFVPDKRGNRTSELCTILPASRELRANARNSRKRPTQCQRVIPLRSSVSQSCPFRQHICHEITFQLMGTSRADEATLAEQTAYKRC